MTKVKDIRVRLRELTTQSRGADFEADGHWRITLETNGNCSWSYTCGCSEECDCYDYYSYNNVEELLADQGIDLDLEWIEE